VGALAALLLAGPAWAVSIDFESGGGPCLFLDAPGPLTTFYQPLGVTFSGPSALDGGAILHECGSFGVGARSGAHFLAFNLEGDPMQNGGHPWGPETLLFSTPVTSASIFAGDAIEGVTIVMQAFDALNQLVDSDMQTAAPESYVELAVSGPAITRVTLERTGGSTSWVFDDLSFTQVPEPSTALLLAFGLVGIAAGRGRTAGR
jgi:hypothetical protein